MDTKQQPLIITVFLIVLIVIVTGCSNFITHPRPNFSIEMDEFKNAGCSAKSSNSYWTCEKDSPISLLGCEQLYPYQLFGALKPAYPIMICESFEQTPPTELLQFYKTFGCMRPIYTSIVIYKDNAFQLVSSKSDFRTLFAPIESPDEALSYALVATNHHANYDSEPDPDYEYLTNKFENTYVEETAKGYKVHLFTQFSPSCSCDPHISSAINILVTREGEISTLDSEPAVQYNGCVD